MTGVASAPWYFLLKGRLFLCFVYRSIRGPWQQRDRKSTRLNSSHANISYAVFCLKKKKTDDAENGTPMVPVRIAMARSIWPGRTKFDFFRWGAVKIVYYPTLAPYGSPASYAFRVM